MMSIRSINPSIVLALGALVLFTTPALYAAAQVYGNPMLTIGQAQPATPKPVAKAAPKVEFLRDIAPILDRGGYSTAECHGKFGGRGGFQLSLLTLSPEDDYDPIV